MKKSPLFLAYHISLSIVGITAFINSINEIFTLGLPDIAVRIIGVVSIVALVVMAFTGVRLFINSKHNKE